MIAAGISLLGCKDEQRSPAPTQTAPSTATAPAKEPAKEPTPAPSAATSAAPVPRLDPETIGPTFDQEVEDKDWAVNTERAIKALAPELTDVDCKQSQCRATLTATNEAELVAKTDKLSEETSLRGTPNAKHVLLTAPKTVDGKLTMQIYVQYDR